jgi:alpha-glucosidase
MTLIKRLVTLFACLGIAVHSQSADTWWKSASVYQIAPLSFKDSDGDGKGDIGGIISKLDYFVETGIDVLLIGPFFQTTMADFAYDISNYVEIDEAFGSMSDVEELFAKAKARGLRIVLDFVPNHTSNRHEWFLHSQVGVSGYEDFYVWHDGIPQINDGRPLPPNNWTSEYGGSSWTWSDMREAYYYHKFGTQQPDLNLMEFRVVEKLDEVLKFWLDKGADGFRIDAVSQLYEDPAFLNTPDIAINLPQTYELIERWRALIDEHSAGKILMPQVWNSPIADLMRYYQSDDGAKQRAQVPMNFMLINELNATSNANDYKRVIESYRSALPDGAIANWFVSIIMQQLDARPIR